MILGIGVDILHLPRLKRILTLKPDRFLRRILTKPEHAELALIRDRILLHTSPALTASTAIQGKRHHEQDKKSLGTKSIDGQLFEHDEALRYVGTRWSLKEASYKAMFPHQKLTWQDVTVTKQDGKPRLIIPEKDRLGIGQTHASISHDGEYLIGQVLFESKE